jgi:hypothetical protein
VRRLRILAAVVALAACGGAPDDGPLETAAAWLAAVYDSDGVEACALFTPEARDAIERCGVVYSTLGEALAESLGAVGVTRDELGDGSVLAAALRGDEATVRIVGTERSLELVRTSDGWRVARGLR